MLSTWKFQLFFSLSLLLAGRLNGAESDSAGAFKQFLSAPPPVASFRFGEPGKNYPSIVQGQPVRYPEGEVVFEGGLQKEGFFLRTLSNSLSQANTEIGAGHVVGRNGDTYWSFNAAQSKLMYSRDEGSPAPVNAPEIVARESEDKVKRALMLGLIHCSYGNLKWEGDSFESESWAGFGPIAGRIRSYTNGAPARIEYSVQKFKPTIFVVSYQYDDNESLPSKIIRGTIEAGKESWYETNSFGKVVLGRPEGFEGYTPSYFVKNQKQTPPKVVFWTNGVQYFVRGDNQLVKLDDSVPIPVVNQSQARRWWKYSLIIVLFVIPFLFFKAAKGGRANTLSRHT